MIRLMAAVILVGSLSSVGFAEEQTVPSTTTEASKPSTESSEKAPTYLICKSKGIVRTLRAQKKPSGACVATYTKSGVDQIVGRSSDMDTCTKVLTNIRENLEKGNWKCKDISEARVSSSEI